MAKLVWDAPNTRLYETGISDVALYVMDNEGAYGTGVAWNGVSSVEESPSGAEANAVYADNTKYLNLYSIEEYSATINAYTYPDEFALCNGESEATTGMYIGQQTRQGFGLVFKTKLGNDSQGTDYGYKLHLVYGLKAGVTSRTHNTINDSPEAEELSWTVNSTPISATVNGVEYTNISTIVINSKEANAAGLAKLEKTLFGDDTTGTPTLPLPAQVYTLLTSTN